MAGSRSKKGRGTGSGGVGEVESSTKVCCRIKFSTREPHIIGRGIAEPVDKVLEFSAINARV